MEKILEITHILQKEADSLDRRIAILNLPTSNLCRKRAEKVEVDGRLEQACRNCVTREIEGKGKMSLDDTKRVIDFFAEQYGTLFITVNGRGDPFHPRLKDETLEKVRYAAKHGIKSYIFTAGTDLDSETCKTLAEYGANVMISLYGNRFIDADFFSGKEYSHSQRSIQDQAYIAENLRMLIGAYKDSNNQPEEGATRVGMNYVVSESDLADGGVKIKKLKEAATLAGLFFICNTPFERNPDQSVQDRLYDMARENSCFNMRHSTAVNDQCQMGAGSSATIDYDGTLLRCPYMDNKNGDGKFQDLPVDELKAVLAKYIADRSCHCVMRGN